MWQGGKEGREKVRKEKAKGRKLWRQAGGWGGLLWRRAKYEGKSKENAGLEMNWFVFFFLALVVGCRWNVVG